MMIRKSPGPAIWRGLLALVLVPLVLGTAPGNASPPPTQVDDSLRLLRTETRDGVAAVRADVERTRGALSRDGIIAQLSALTNPGRQLISPPELTPTTGMPNGAPLPRQVSHSVAGLLTAVRGASEIARSNLDDLPNAGLEARSAALTAMREDQTLPLPASARAEAGPMGGALTPARHAEPTMSASVVARRGASGPSNETALVALAAALDRHLPALKAAAAHLSESKVAGDLVPACDLVDEPPLLCVSSEANNLSTKNVALKIDLGGDDVHQDSSGGADALAATPLPVAVSLDLAGNDRYDPSSDAGVVVQGASLGGIGILVDSAGDDAYLARARDGVSLAQAAAGSLVGATAYGYLLDSAGADEYLVLPPNEADASEIYAQAVATSPGLLPDDSLPRALLSDRGAGRDSFKIDLGTMDPGRVASRYVRGQGAAYSSRAVLFDEEGLADLATVGHISGGYAPDGDNSVATTRLYSVGVQARSNGVGGSSAMLLAGPGDTHYTIDLSNEGGAFAFISGQGYGSTSVGVINDSGGNDTYSTRYQSDLVINGVVDDTCRQGRVGCPSARWEEKQQDFTGGEWTTTQGSGSLGGMGIVEDASGNDTYQADSAASLRVTLDDKLSAPQSAPTLDAVGPGLLWHEAQGAGDFGGAGLLLDHSGDDRYTTTARSEVSATASSTRAVGVPEVTAVSGDVWLIGQGAAHRAGSGALLDLGGAHDVFHAEATGAAHTSPDPLGAFQRALMTPLAQGASSGHGTAAGVFVADGDDPHIVSNTNSEVCQDVPSFRGFGSWSECPDSLSNGSEFGSGSRGAVGRAPKAIGTPTLLSFVADTATGTTISASPHRRVPRVPASAQLLDAAGRPIAGALVHFQLQFGEAENHYVHDLPGSEAANKVCNRHAIGAACTYPLWQIDARTDARGVATAVLPASLHPIEFVNQNMNPDRARLYAVYDGEPGPEAGGPGHYPAYATHVLSVQ